MKPATTGRVRRPTSDEASDPASIFLPHAVLQLDRVADARDLPRDLPQLASRVASFIDGVRPLARVKRKSAVSPAELRDALMALWRRDLLRVVGIVEDAFEAPPTTVGSIDVEPPDETVSRASPDVIPASVMAEIEAMLEEVARLDELDGWDVITEVTDKAIP